MRSPTCAPAPSTGSPTPTTPRTSCSRRRRWWCRATRRRSAGCSPPPSGAGVPLTFRSGGTSLSGQAVTDGILVDTRRHFRRIEVLDDGARVRVRPGRHDPAGQRPARRATGASSAPTRPARAPARSAASSPTTPRAWPAARRPTATARWSRCVLVLPSGTVVDTGAPDADERLRRARAGTARRARCGCATGCVATPRSRAKIERQFSMKNTMGYGLNSFLDHTRPVDDPRPPRGRQRGHARRSSPRRSCARCRCCRHAATGAARVRRPVRGHRRAAGARRPPAPATIELLDATSLRVGQTDPQADAAAARSARGPSRRPCSWSTRRADGGCSSTRSPPRPPACSPAAGHRPAALAADPAARAGCGTSARACTRRSPAPARPAPPRCWRTSRAGARAAAHLRAADRAVRPARLRGRVIFGHAKDGNIHFMLTERLRRRPDRPASLRRVHRGHGRAGARPRRHAQGRARHRPRSWRPSSAASTATSCTTVMREVKRLCDPAGVLNPGVVLTDDADAHLRDLKAAPTVESEVDRCVECGYCEPVCPSRGPHHHAAAAHRAAPRDGRGRGRGRHGAGRRARGRLRATTASTPARSTACARPPARC